ncbi:hypothetical protein MNV49_004365, partial [Pseudohyphozyma bogoriensis]
VNGSFSLSYADGSSTEGDVYRDTVTIAGVSATGQSEPVPNVLASRADGWFEAFAVTTSESSDFDGRPISGILGMAYQSLSALGAKPVFQTMYAQGNFPNNQFSFMLREDGDSELLLGGQDISKFTGDMTWSDGISTAYWAVSGDFLINGQNVASSQSFVIDTGSTYLIGTRENVAKFYSNIPGAAVSLLYSGYYTVPCSTLNELSFNVTFAGSDQQFNIPMSLFNLGTADALGLTCLGGLYYQDLGGDFWVLGDLFLQSVYSTFDFYTNQVGFANLA